MSAEKGQSVEPCTIHRTPAVLRFGLTGLAVCQECADRCPPDELFPLDQPGQTVERGCEACYQIGPLLVAPGTSGRSWTCGACGHVWRPEVDRGR